MVTVGLDMMVGVESAVPAEKTVSAVPAEKTVSADKALSPPDTQRKTRTAFLGTVTARTQLNY